MDNIVMIAKFIVKMLTMSLVLATSTYGFSHRTRPLEIQVWKNAIVPYQLSENFTSDEVAVINKTLQEVSRKTCVKFNLIPWGPAGHDKDYVTILKAEYGCYSHALGRVGGQQIIRLSSFDKGCVRHGRIAYQVVMRTLGFYEEHLRPDRDNFVSILWSHVSKGKERYLLKHNTALFNLTDLPYDFESVTHGGLYKFAKEDNEMTIVPTKYGVSIGQQDGFSEGDIQKIRHVYCTSSRVFSDHFVVFLMFLMVFIRVETI